MPRSAAPASGVIRWIASVAGRAGYLTALLLAVQSVLALCGVDEPTAAMVMATRPPPARPRLLSAVLSGWWA